MISWLGLFSLHYLTSKIYNRSGRDPKKPDEVFEGKERLLSFEVIKTEPCRAMNVREGELRSPCLLFLLVKHKEMCKECEKKSL